MTLANELTYREVLTWASSFLRRIDKEEQAATWLLKELMDWSLTDLIIKQDQVMPKSLADEFKEAIYLFGKDMPAQYILGHEWFYGRKFQVNTHTLIPRPETEEWFASYLPNLPDKTLKVLDIGTGSGVLAISHKLERPKDQVTALDISTQALQVAKKNALSHGAQITFVESNLMERVKPQSFDLVISNPPYIGLEEWERMDESVRRYEPKEALFASDQGLAIYNNLAKDIKPYLASQAVIMVEIGDRQGDQVAAIFNHCYPKAQIRVDKDMAGKDRLVKVFL